MRTVQRGLDRLCAARLIEKRPRLTPSGAPARGLRYDLSALAGLMPARAPRLSSGQWGGADTPSGDTRHGCRPESEADVVCESDTPPAPVAAPPPDLVALLTRAGVFPSAAPRLLDTYGAARCRLALAALRSRPDVRDRPAWLVACLRDGWALPPKTSYPGLPEARHPAPKGRESGAGVVAARPVVVKTQGPSPPDPFPSGKGGRACTDGRGGPAPDPLDALPPEQYADWERRARAELVADVALGPVVRGSLARGRSTFLVRARMRRWLPPAPA